MSDLFWVIIVMYKVYIFTGCLWFQNQATTVFVWFKEYCHQLRKKLVFKLTSHPTDCENTLAKLPVVVVINERLILAVINKLLYAKKTRFWHILLSFCLIVKVFKCLVNIVNISKSLCLTLSEAKRILFQGVSGVWSKTILLRLKKEEDWDPSLSGTV